MKSITLFLTLTVTILTQTSNAIAKPFTFTDTQPNLVIKKYELPRVELSDPYPTRVMQHIDRDLHQLTPQARSRNSQPLLPNLPKLPK